MIRIFLLALLFLALILDSTLVSFPLVFALGVLFYVLYPEELTVLIVFIFGLAIDVLRLMPIGATSVFLLISCAFIYLYRNTFELKDMQYIILLPYIFAYIYSLILGYDANLLIFLMLLAVCEGIIYYFSSRKKSIVSGF